MNECEFKQRAYDGKWERVEKVPDPENAYRYKTESGNVVTMIPEKWVTTGVFDYMMEFVD
jgi:hypothetical protein